LDTATSVVNSTTAVGFNDIIRNLVSATGESRVMDANLKSCAMWHRDLSNQAIEEQSEAGTSGNATNFIALGLEAFFRISGKY
jgi:hypothetical protein